ncbi:alpha/beta hydrolase [Haliangium ochraceum]|uniref:Alpha/beta hydrolase fold protein n=1 Tax=Haliangium ochraceum (strain DSM 14365 / JCM 11303 / SMP-2) TaxID=502025 RepID=D0LHJ7_HALO1|nr:alpha/beta fold hydrolase [Haliangium ochraceum]ACY12859.1 alpha/beta hydrolase fold protein [Haliangium ochraceum DSM 14365]
MDSLQREDRDPFRFPAVTQARDGAGEFGVLCIHGFTGTPFEMHHLGWRLSQRGFTALGPRLPGHGTDLEDLDGCRWQDWYGAVEAAFDELRGSCERVAVAGQSLGGLLALHLAAERGDDMVAVAALATPLWLPALSRAAIWATRPNQPLTARIGQRTKRFPKFGGSDVRDLEMKQRNPCYRAVPVRALHQLVAFMDKVRGELSRVRVPTLVLHGRRDHTAPFACSTYLAREVGAALVRHRGLSESFHLIAVDVERDLVADEVGGFFERIAAARAGAA